MPTVSKSAPSSGQLSPFEMSIKGAAATGLKNLLSPHFMPMLASYIHSVKNHQLILSAQSSEKSKENDLSQVPISNQTSSKPTHVKVCSLFKPLLRRFRSFFRNKFDQGRKISLYQHWKPEGFLSHIRKFMRSMHLPEALMDEINTLKVLTIIFPCTVKRVKPNQHLQER